MLIDTHCHLASSSFDQTQRQELIRRAKQAGVERMITQGTNMDDWAATLSWSQDFPGIVFPTLGIHPNDVQDVPSTWKQQLIELAQHHRLAAIGETGLDYYHPAPEGWEESSYRKLQAEMLSEHFEAASRLNLNIVLHTRDRSDQKSFDDALTIAKSYRGKVRPVFHCFIGNQDQARQIIDQLDGMVSFTGVITFKNAQQVAETARWCPTDRLMLETDSPYLSPIPLRGHKNEPSHMIHTATFLADLKNITTEELAHYATENAESFFRLK